MLTDTELSAMRGAAVAALPDRAQIVRTSYTSDGMGGTVAAGTEVATIAARITTLSQQDLTEYADKLGARNGYQLTAPVTAEVAPRDRVRIGERTFEVLACPVRGRWELTRRVIVVEVVQ